MEKEIKSVANVTRLTCANSWNWLRAFQSGQSIKNSLSKTQPCIARAQGAKDSGSKVLRIR